MSFVELWLVFSVFITILSFIFFILFRTPEYFYQVIGSLLFIWILVGFGKLISLFKSGK